MRLRICLSKRRSGTAPARENAIEALLSRPHRIVTCLKTVCLAGWLAGCCCCAQLVVLRCHGCTLMADGCIRKARSTGRGCGQAGAPPQCTTSAGLPGTEQLAARSSPPTAANLPICSSYTPPAQNRCPPTYRGPACATAASHCRTPLLRACPASLCAFSLAAPDLPHLDVFVYSTTDKLGPRISATGIELRRSGFVTLPRNKTRRREPITAPICNLAGDMYVSST